MRELLEAIAKAIAHYPEAVTITARDKDGVTMFELRAHPTDLGRLIGKEGRVVGAMRTLLDNFGTRSRTRFALEVVEDRNASAAGQS